MYNNNRDVENLLSNPRRALLTMSLPMLFALLVEKIQIFVDGVWCSGLGSDAMSAISMSSPIYGMIAAFGTGLGIGISAAIARFIGAGDKESADNATAGTIVIVFISSILASIIMYFVAEPIIIFCGGEADLELCMEYVYPSLIFSFFLMMNAVLAGMLRSEGAARRAMILSVIASVVNIVLDPILIYGAGLGVLGASLATCLSFVVITVIGLRWYLTGRTYVNLDFKNYKFNATPVKEVLIIGIPCAIEMLVQPLISVPQNAVVYACGGEAGFVCYTYAFRFIEIALIPSIAIGKSLIPVISAAIGQRDTEKILQSCKMTYKYILSMEVVFMIIILLGADFFVEAFMGSESMQALHDELALAVRIFSLTCIFHTCRVVGTSIMEATRHAVVATVLTIARELLFLGTFIIAAGISMHAIYWACDVTNFIMMFVITAFAYYYIRDLVKRLQKEDSGAEEGAVRNR